MEKAISGTDFRKMKVPAPVVRRDMKGHLDFYNAKLDSWDYWIDEVEITTRRGLIHWVEHLTEKNWVTTAHVRELCAISYSLLPPSKRI